MEKYPDQPLPNTMTILIPGNQNPFVTKNNENMAWNFPPRKEY